MRTKGKKILREDQSHAFWAEMSPCEHLVQIYETNDVFMDTLAGFIGGGLRLGHAAVAIATPEHRHDLYKRLTAMGLDVAAARSCDQFIALDAEETLGKFIVDGWPDDDLFTGVVREILERAGRDGRKVRAFGEMVALLWAQRNFSATVRLEHLWHELCQKESFSLFCAYPKSGFTQNPSESIAQVCAAHSKVLAG